jgi:hypothetical protein
MAAPIVGHADLGARPTDESGNREEWRKSFPIKLHPPAEMSAWYIAKFIAEMPNEFEQLKSLIRQRKDLGSSMSDFERFLTRAGFDQKYHSLGVFSVLIETARR